MLEEIRVEDLALLQSVDLTLAPGLNVLSGETGEGKSLLLAAIQLLLGGRARKGLVRSGQKEAVIEGRFRLTSQGPEIAKLTDLFTEGNEEICLRRVITSEGQSRAYLDGSMVPVGLLMKLGAVLVDIHGQRHSLLKAAEQRAALDRFAGLSDKVEKYASVFGKYREVADRLQSREDEQAGRAERSDFLRFQIAELEEIEPQQGEESALDAQLKLLSQGAEIEGALNEAARMLTEGSDAVDALCARVVRRLQDCATGDAVIAQVIERLAALKIEAEDLGSECAHKRDALDLDPGTLQETEERLSAIRHLAKRHRKSGDELYERLAELKLELAELEGAGQSPEQLEQELARLHGQLEKLGKSLVAARSKAAKKLEKEVRSGLKELRMERAQFRVDVQPNPWPKSGFDPATGGAEGPGAVRFFVAANPGEPEQPMEKVASGGEMARILLGLKGALAGAHDIPLLIFDEIDAGVGGRVGLPFGRRIAAIARHHQVLVVTHLPQVAAFAEKHLRVRKEVKGGRTRTQVEILVDEDRTAELAAMLGGTDVNTQGRKAARDQARALIAEAQT